MFSIDTKKKTQAWKSFDFYKDNWSLIIFLPALLGGILQIIKLFNLDPSFVRFFAVEQVVPDGLLILFLLTLGTITYFIFRNSIKLQNIKKLKLGWRFSNVISNIKSQLVFLTYLLLMVGFISLANIIEEESITIGYIVFKTVLEFLILKCLFEIFFITTILYILREHDTISQISSDDVNKITQLVENITEKPIQALVFSIVTMCLLFFIFLRINYFYSTINALNLPINESVLVKKIQKDLNIDKSPKIEYYNGKYIFLSIKKTKKESEYLVLKGDLLINILNDKDK